MKNFLKVVVFSLCIIGGYTLFATEFAPAIKPEPPVVTNPTPETMTGAELAAFGKTLFYGKGSCALCHERVGGRAPSLDTIALNGAKRIKEPGYKGTASSAASYIYESMTSPSAYVVPGYGSTGSVDTRSPMPDVRKPPVSLSQIEIRAVIAFLQDRAGVPVTTVTKIK